MKMGGSLFWGIVLIIVGLSLIVKVVFHIDFPIIKVLFAFFFIFLGIKILVGGWGSHIFRSGPNDVVFGQGKFVHENVVPKEQNVIFGNGSIDFRRINMNALPAEIEINTVFSGCEVLLKKDLPVKIKIDAAMSGVSLPNNNTTVLGSAFYQSPNFNEKLPYLSIKANAVFSGLKIIID
jgi:predicted membrane protein